MSFLGPLALTRLGSGRAPRTIGHVVGRPCGRPVLLAALLMAASVAGAAPLPGGAGPAAAPAKPTIAVPDLIAWHAPADDAVVLSSFVRTAVVKSGAYAVVDKNNMDKVLAEQAFQQTGCTSQECAVKLGRILKVDRILIGTLGVYEDARVLTAQIVEVETGRIAASESITIPPHERIEDTAGRFVRSLLDTPAPADAAEPVAAAPPAPGPSPSGRPWIGPAPDAPTPSRPAVRDEDLPRSRSPWLWVAVAAALAAVFGGVAAGLH